MKLKIQEQNTNSDKMTTDKSSPPQTDTDMYIQTHTVYTTDHTQKTLYIPIFTE